MSDQRPYHVLFRMKVFVSLPFASLDSMMLQKRLYEIERARLEAPDAAVSGRR